MKIRIFLDVMLFRPRILVPSSSVSSSPRSVTS